MIVFDMRWVLYVRRRRRAMLTYHLSLVIIKEWTERERRVIHSLRNAVILVCVRAQSEQSLNRLSQMLLEIENSSLFSVFSWILNNDEEEEKEVYCLLNSAAAVRLSRLRHVQRLSRGISYRKSHGPIRWHHVLAYTITLSATVKLIHQCLRTITPFLVPLCS